MNETGTNEYRNEPPAPAPPQRSGATRAILITTAVIGGIALLGAGVSAGVQAVRSQVVHEPSLQSVDTSGISAVRADVSAASFTLEYGNVDEARLETSGTRAEWRMQRSGDQLRVEQSRTGWFPWNWCFGWCDIDGEVVTLTLPQELERGGGIDATIDLSSGAVRADGAFRDLTFDLSAGSIVATGEARSLDVDMSAGRLETDFADVRTASFDLSAGSVDARLRGSAPDSVDIDVSAGSFDFTLPDAQYRVESDVSAGSVDNRLDTSSSSPHHVRVGVSAGNVVLAPEG